MRIQDQIADLSDEIVALKLLVKIREKQRSRLRREAGLTAWKVEYHREKKPDDRFATEDEARYFMENMCGEGQWGAPHQWMPVGAAGGTVAVCTLSEVEFNDAKGQYEWVKGE